MATIPVSNQAPGVVPLRPLDFETVVLQHVPDAVITLSSAGRITFLNSAAELLLGASAKEAAGQPYSTLFTFPREPKGASSLLDPLLSGCSRSETGTHWLALVRSSREILALGTAGAISGNPRDAGAVLLIRDITAWDRSRRDFIRTRYLETMQQLACSVSTHCNNLATAIQGSVETLQKPQSQSHERQLHNLQNLQRALDSVTLLTRQLRAFGRRLPPDPRLLDLNAAIRAILPLLEHESGPSQKLVLELDPALARIEIDPSHVEEIAFALVQHAFENTPKDGALRMITRNFQVTPEYALHFADLAPGAYTLLELSYPGSALQIHDDDCIFDPFFATRSQGGSLGLAAVYGLTRQSGGHIWFESSPRDGTRFSLCWPSLENAPDAALVSAGSAGRESILVVEPDPHTRDLALRALLHSGYHVLEAASASQALRICRQWDGEVDLILLNPLTPSLTGPEFTQRLLALRPNAKVLFMSGYHSRILIEEGARIDARFIQKPFSPDALVRKVRHSLDS